MQMMKNSRLRKYFTVSIIVALFVPLLSCLSIAQQTNKEEETLFVAKKAFEDGFYEVSFGLFERFLKEYPESSKVPEINLLMGECYFHQSRYLDALGKFEELLNNPKAHDIKDAVLYWIGEVHFKGNNFEKAASYYKMIVDDFPKSYYAPAAYYSLGWSFFQQQEYRKAIDSFKLLISKFPRESQVKDAAFKVIECLYNLKEYSALRDSAKNYLKAYSKDTARLPYLYFYEAEANFYLDSFNDAAESYAKAIKGATDPKVVSLSKLGQAWSYLKLKRYTDAESVFSDINIADLEKKAVDVLFLGKAILMTETNRINEAASVYDDLIKTQPEPSVLTQAYMGKADALYNLAKYDEAIKVYREALDKTKQENIPSEIIDKLHHSLAWAYLKQGEFKEAIAEFQNIVKESDDKTFKVSALCQIGDAYQDSGDYAKAQTTYDSILKDYPDSLYSDYVQYQLGLTFLKASNYDGAILSLLNFRKNYPTSKLFDNVTYALGLAYFQKQDYESSRQIFEKFDEFKDSSLKQQSAYLLGTSFFNLGRFSEAIEIFKNLIRLYGQDKQLAQKAEYEIADCYYQMGNEKEAMNRFKILRSKYPESSLTAEIIWWLGEYYYRHNDLVLARRYFLSLVQDFPKSNLVPDAYYAIGSSFEEEGRHREALDNFKKVLQLGKTDLAAQAAVAIADIYTSMGNSEEALRIYQETAGNYPNLTSLTYPKIADIYFRKSNYAEAVEYLRKSLDLVPAKAVPEIQFKIGEALEAQGSTDEAIEEYLKVTYLSGNDNPQAIKALLRIAQIYEGRKNFIDALNVYKKIISMNVEESKFAQERAGLIKQQIK